MFQFSAMNRLNCALCHFIEIGVALKMFSTAALDYARGVCGYQSLT